MPTNVIHHLVEIDPPNERRDTWLVVCSQGDFNRSFLNRVTARRESNTHINSVMLADDLANNRYRYGGQE